MLGPSRGWSSSKTIGPAWTSAPSIVNGVGRPRSSVLWSRGGLCSYTFHGPQPSALWYISIVLRRSLTTTAICVIGKPPVFGTMSHLHGYSDLGCLRHCMPVLCRRKSKSVLCTRPFVDCPFSLVQRMIGNVL